MDWRECIRKRIAKEVKEDIDLINSLIRNSINKLKSSDELEMKETTAVSKFSLTYDSLREILEAIAIKEGYKIYNHDCFTAFLKEILNEENLGEEFDEIRRIRNDVNYYGKQIPSNESNEIIYRIKSLRKNLFDKYLK